VEVIERQKTPQPVPAEEAQEITPLLGCELRINCISRSEPNPTRDQANALGVFLQYAAFPAEAGDAHGNGYARD
jgi:hypothetical protein